MGRKEIQGPDPAPDPRGLFRGANKTQIVHSCCLNFYTVVPCLEMITRNGLADRVEGTMVRYRTTAKGEVALEHMRELVELRGKRDDETKNRSLSPTEEMKRYNNYQIKNYCI